MPFEINAALRCVCGFIANSSEILDHHSCRRRKGKYRNPHVPSSFTMLNTVSRKSEREQIIALYTRDLADQDVPLSESPPPPPQSDDHTVPSSRLETFQILDWRNDELDSNMVELVLPLVSTLSGMQSSDPSSSSTIPKCLDLSPSYSGPNPEEHSMLLMDELLSVSPSSSGRISPLAAKYDRRVTNQPTYQPSSSSDDEPVGTMACNPQDLASSRSRRPNLLERMKSYKRLKYCRERDASNNVFDKFLLRRFDYDSSTDAMTSGSDLE